MLSRRTIIIGVIAAAAISAAVLGYASLRTSFSKPADPFENLRADKYSSERAELKRAIDELGTTKAYEAFKADTFGKEFGVAHTLSHIMGELIYEKEGIAGIAICDGAFSFGCYHSFFGKAISEYGIDVVYDLDRACSERWKSDSVACAHGIGHGLLGYLGDEELLSALDVCSTLSYKEPVGGCRGGVFMEFNFHTMQNPDSAVEREFDPENPHYPCRSVPGDHRRACYFEQPQWWLRVLDKDFRLVGELCSEAETEGERRTCFEGVGNIAAPDSSYDPLAARGLCSQMPDSDSTSLCLKGASWSFLAEPTAKDRAKEVCEGLPTAERSACGGWAQSE